jgi:hypothetical protein
MSDTTGGTLTILALSREQHPHFAPLYEVPGWRVIETPEWHPDKLRELLPDILLTPSCDWFESNACIKGARRMGIPTLYVMDGIIEWRHEWENPRWNSREGVPYNQPVTTDKIACLGWQSARTLEAWGNVGKCEIVGAPRFDHYLCQPVRHREHDGCKRLLIMTANTPGFTPEQLALVERSLLDVKEYLEAQSDWAPIWRVRRGLDVKLGLSHGFAELRDKPLRAALAEADAVLTTPSTVLLEAMLAGVPAGLLDYTNSPPYVPAAWMVTAPQQIDPVLRDLVHPPARRLVFQDEVLHNCLECRTPATPRIRRLIEVMAAIGRESRAANRSLEFPDRILPVELAGHAIPSEHFEMSRLYPDHPVVADADRAALQRELIYARQELSQLRREIELRRAGYWLSVVGRKIHHRLRRTEHGATS